MVRIHSRGIHTFVSVFLYKNLYLQVTKVDDENESVVSQKRSFPRTYARVQPACSSISSILYLLMSIIRNDALLSRVKIALPPSLLPPPTGDEGNRRISWPSSTSPTRAARFNIFFDDRLNSPPPPLNSPPPPSWWKKPWFVLRNNRSFRVLFFFFFFLFWNRRKCEA